MTKFTNNGRVNAISQVLYGQYVSYLGVVCFKSEITFKYLLKAIERDSQCQNGS